MLQLVVQTAECSAEDCSGRLLSTNLCCRQLVSHRLAFRSSAHREPVPTKADSIGIVGHVLYFLRWKF